MNYKSSLSQDINKGNNGTSSTGLSSYTSKMIDSSAINVLGSTYSFSTDGNRIYVEGIPQNGIKHFRVWIGSLTDNPKSPVSFKVCLVGHPVLNRFDLLAAYLDTEVSVLLGNAIAYAQSARVQRVRQALPTSRNAKDRYSNKRESIKKSHQQNKLMRNIKVR
mgnify:CR=1 FL=1